MGRLGYDDWNFMGEVQKEQRIRKESKSKSESSLKSSFVLVCAVCLLSFLGLVCVYSASFPVAVKNGLNHYYYLINQCVYMAIGILLFVLVNVLPTAVIKILSPIFMFACIVLLGFDVFMGGSILLSSDTIGFVYVAVVMYMSLYFANRNNSLAKLRQLIVPGVGCLLVLVLLLLKKSFAYALMFIGVGSVMFIAGGVGVFGMVLLLLYLLVPVLSVVFSKSDILLSVTRFLIPGAGSGSRTDQVSVIRTSIASGSWFGKGLGMGEYKTGEIADMAGRCIFANVCEETGFFGALVLIAVFLVLGFIGYRVARSLRRHDDFYSNMAVGCTTVIVWQMIINIAWLLGFVPGDGIPLPFFSYGLEVVPALLACGLVYKASRQKPNIDDPRVVETIQDELMFPERYEFEKV